MAIQVFFGCNEAVVLRYSGLGFEDVGMGCSGVLFCIVVASFMYENAIQLCGLKVLVFLSETVTCLSCAAFSIVVVCGGL